jgi:hypothetical protein
MDPISVGIFLSAMGINGIVSFIAGMLTERAVTQRVNAELERQVLLLSKKSVNVEDRYKKLLCACALYDIPLLTGSQSPNEDVRSLIFEFSAVAA